jgi:hypothetical protein
MQTITAGASLVAELPARSLEPLDHLAHNVGAIGKSTQLPNLA